MIKYSIAMGVRMVCILLMLVAQGWWLLVCAIGAIVLPYVAVVIANTEVATPSRPVLRPGGVEIYRGGNGDARNASDQTPKGGQ